MNMNLIEFENNLNIYGSDLGSWPEEIRSSAEEFYNSSAEAKQLVAEEKAFEVNMDLVAPEAPSPNFANQIIAASLARTNKVSQETEEVVEVDDFLTDLLRRIFIPRPAFAVALSLVIGFAVGYGGDSAQNQGGDYEQGMFLFEEYDGGIL